MHEPSDNLTQNASRRSRRAIVAIVLLAAAFRLVALDRVPPGVAPDEAVNAFDANCLRVAGKDHLEKPWPVFLRSFGDFHPSPPVYLQIPFQMILGMNEWSARLPDALFGVLQVLLVYLLVAPLYGPRAALWAAGLLAVSPWHVHLSRLAFGIVIASSLTTFAAWALVRGLGRLDENRRMKIPIGPVLAMMLAGFGLGVASWTYHAMRAVVPLLILGGALLGHRKMRSSFRSPVGRARLISFTAGLMLGLAPFVVAWHKAPDEVWARASERSLLHQNVGVADAISKVLHNYAVHFSPSYLFLDGDRSLIQSVPGYGELHLLYALLLPLGLIRVLRRWRSERSGLFVLWWILIAPIPASLAVLDTGSGHCLRSAGVFPAHEILAAVGLEMTLAAVRRRSLQTFRAATAAAFLCTASGAVYFAFIFFARYPVAAAKDFQADWKPVIEEIQRRHADYDAVMITTDGCAQVGVLHLFYADIDPRSYFREPRMTWQTQSFDLLARWSKFFYASIELLPKVRELIPATARILIAERPGVPVPGRELKRFPDRFGRPWVVLYEIDLEVRGEPATSRPR